MFLVLDCSVVVKWFKEEEDSGLALKIREEFYNGSHEIVVPDLILYELANALRYDKKFTPQLIKEATASLFEIGIVIVTPSVDLISEAVSIASECNTTVYDASYLALARNTGGTFITSDADLYRKTKKLGSCRLLSESGL